MSNPLTIVTYHYVRNLENSSYPEIKGLPLADFEEQIGYLSRFHEAIGARELMAALRENEPLPPNSLLLTFDDGYADHYKNVLPVLEKNDMKGCFFPPARCILERKVLTVNKIHFLLASIGKTEELVSLLYDKIAGAGEEWELDPPEAYWERVARKERWDPPEVVFCKRMLQRELPRTLRRRWASELFHRFVTDDEAGFSEELYMSLGQIRELRERGMYVGSHGYDHFWMNTLGPAEQEEELDRSLEFLEMIGADTDRWILCYPYGAHDQSLKERLKARNCVAALTTERGLSEIGRDDPLALPRLDTNDLPKRKNAEPGEWTRKAGAVPEN